MRVFNHEDLAKSLILASYKDELKIIWNICYQDSTFQLTIQNLDKNSPFQH